MIGGRVIEVCEVKTRPGKLFVNVADRPYNYVETCGVLVQDCENSRMIEIGDNLWWQGSKCYWTPQNSPREKQGIDFDIQIAKMSGSGITMSSLDIE